MIDLRHRTIPALPRGRALAAHPTLRAAFFLLAPFPAVEAVTHYAFLREFPALYFIVLVLGASYVAGTRVAIVVAVEAVAIGLALGGPFDRRLTAAGLLVALLTLGTVITVFGRAFARERVSREAAEASERWFRRIFEGAPVGLIAIDPGSGRIEVANPAFCAISGRAADGLVGALAADLLEDTGAAVAGAEATSKVASGELRFLRGNAVIVRPGGERVIVEVVATRIERLAGSSQVVWSVVDQTASIRAGEALAESESRYRRLLETAFEGVVLDLDGRIVEADAGFEAISGYSSAELVGRPIAELLAPRSRAEGRVYRDAGATEAIEMTGRRRDGSELLVEVRSQGVTYGGQQARLTGVVDLGRRARAEDARAAAERRYRALFESAGVGIAVSAIDGTLIEANEMLASMLGCTPEEMAGRSHRAWHDPLDPVDAHVRLALMRGERDSYSVEHNLVHRDGTRVPMRISESLVRDERGAPLYTVSVLESIAERRRLEEAVRQTQKMEAVGRLAGGIAHDFNNLLAVIAGQASLLEAADLPEAALEPLDEIEEATRRAAELTRQLLAFSRKQVLRPQAIAVNQAIVELERLLRRVLPSNIEIALRLGADLPPVLADPGQFDQVVMNLALNARDAMSEGGRIRIGTEAIELPEGRAGLPGGRYVALTVADAGVGIDAELAGRIFEPFFTTKQPGEGTGLGLATVYGIVTQSGGAVTVDSEPGRGATFTVLLPEARAASTEPASPRAQPGDGAGSVNVPGRVLLVEDDPSMRRLAGQLLLADGHEVLLAAHGGDALALIDSAGPLDVVVTDLVMPGMSGRDLAREVRLRDPDVGILYMSGYAGDTPARPGDPEADAEVIAKPFTAALLRSRVTASASASRAARRGRRRALSPR